MSDEWQVTRKQEIHSVDGPCGPEGSISYIVGHHGVTRIEQVLKSGMYSNLAYLRVWAGDKVLAELPQHNTEHVRFKIDD